MRRCLILKDGIQALSIVGDECVVFDIHAQRCILQQFVHSFADERKPVNLSSQSQSQSQMKDMCIPPP